VLYDFVDVAVEFAARELSIELLLVFVEVLVGYVLLDEVLVAVERELYEEVRGA
jgi:hypothetical protein